MKEILPNVIADMHNLLFNRSLKSLYEDDIDEEYKSYNKSYNVLKRDFNNIGKDLTTSIIKIYAKNNKIIFLSEKEKGIYDELQKEILSKTIHNYMKNVKTKRLISKAESSFFKKIIEMHNQIESEDKTLNIPIFKNELSKIKIVKAIISNSNKLQKRGNTTKDYINKTVKQKITDISLDNNNKNTSQAEASSTTSVFIKNNI